jgi:hypothetical protein
MTVVVGDEWSDEGEWSVLKGEEKGVGIERKEDAPPSL